jgi:solute carrier family 25 carnitine/acylcarnitine transporter 20/29
MSQWFKDYICATIAGTCGTIVGHPLDTIKCRMQIQSDEYKTMTSSFVKIYKEERFKGLFKGLVPPLLNNLPINAM